MKIKTQDLIGKALDWAVAHAVGLPQDARDLMAKHDIDPFDEDVVWGDNLPKNEP